MPSLSTYLRALPGVAKSILGMSPEGSWLGGFFGASQYGNLFSLSRKEDGWQRGLSHAYYDSTKVPIVYSCVIAYCRVISACWAKHIRITEGGRHEHVKTSWQARLLRKPNSYETFYQFIFNIVGDMLFRGACLVIIARDNRNVPISLYRVPYGHWTIHVEPETKEIFYGISNGTPFPVPEVPINYLVPARDVIHFRQHCPRNPLVGETPIEAAALAIGINVSLARSQALFFSQMRRPSGILSTEQDLKRDQIDRLRAAFDAQAEGMAQGKVPIMSNGLKFQPMAITSQDAQLVEAQRMSIEDVCRVFGVPPPIVASNHDATLNNAESLIRFWLSTGLGSLLENIEQSLASAFGMGEEEYIEFDTESLHRLDWKARIETLAKGVMGGVYKPNEARAKESLEDVEGGDQVFLQQQMWPVNLLADNARNITSARLNTDPKLPNASAPGTATEGQVGDANDPNTNQDGADKGIDYDFVSKHIKITLLEDA
jgi:HK97 family phage portal protein